MISTFNLGLIWVRLTFRALLSDLGPKAPSATKFNPSQFHRLLGRALKSFFLSRVTVARHSEQLLVVTIFVVVVQIGHVPGGVMMLVKNTKCLELCPGLAH